MSFKPPMRCAIMQPTYLPWAGYFQLMRQVDRFVFLDDVQFERRSWQSRNRILLQGKEHVLTVPVRKAERDTPMHRIEVSYEADWQRSHWQTLTSAYSKAEHGPQTLSLLQPFYQAAKPARLVDLNVGIIRALAAALDIPTELLLASDLGCGETRSFHLIRICEALGCDEYVSPRGSMEYLEEDHFTSHTAVRLTFQDYSPEAYPQRHAPAFVSHLSVVDVMAHAGLDAARSYIR